MASNHYIHSKTKLNIREGEMTILLHETLMGAHPKRSRMSVSTSEYLPATQISASQHLPLRVTWCERIFIDKPTWFINGNSFSSVYKQN